ncbi:hypothetical protein [Calothrix sp. UHCC 0171]|uniref:hypothetical protein n=1 Tax=Calothrix sp. UHCC 0171 TaxID=3110245 RepID=UPI002B20E77D|nr:hypothetical protein [Calothrix sp. UHCC 0171]MEA5570736.1 hypothetical protein [Calothrix sp. UHCC 0171]
MQFDSIELIGVLGISRNRVSLKINMTISEATAIETGFLPLSGSAKLIIHSENFKLLSLRGT